MKIKIHQSKINETIELTTTFYYVLNNIIIRSKGTKIVKGDSLYRANESVCFRSRLVLKLNIIEHYFSAIRLTI